MVHTGLNIYFDRISRYYGARFVLHGTSSKAMIGSILLKLLSFETFILMESAGIMEQDSPYLYWMEHQAKQWLAQSLWSCWVLNQQYCKNNIFSSLETFNAVMNKKYIFSLWRIYKVIMVKCINLAYKLKGNQTLFSS